MNKYKLILFVLTLSLISSCSDDGYSLGEFRIQLATVNPLGSNTYSLTLDNGKTLWPAASDVNYMPKNNQQRVVVNYTLLSDQQGGYDHYVKVNSIADILTKNVVELTSQNEEEIGNDPIQVTQLWAGDHFLNFRVFINIGGQAQHSINLVCNKLDNIALGNDTLVLELRQNANGDTPKYPNGSYVAFDMKPFEMEGKRSRIVKVKFKDFDEKEKEHVLTYQYVTKKDSDLIELTEMPNGNLTLQ